MRFKMAGNDSRQAPAATYMPATRSNPALLHITRHGPTITDMTKDLKHLVYYRFNTGPVGKGPGDWTLSGGLGDLLDLGGFITASTTIEHNDHTAESVSMGFRYLLSPTAERGCDPRRGPCHPSASCGGGSC